MHAGSAELAGGDFLAGHLANHRWASEEHARGVGHNDEVRKRRGVAAAAGGGARDHRDLRHLTGHRDVLGEYARVAVQRGEAFLHARPARLHEADHWDAGLPGHPLHAHDRVCVLRTQRAAGERRVLREAEHQPPADS